MAHGNHDGDLFALGRELDRQRRRAWRLKRQMDHGTAEWSAWSRTTDAAFSLVDRIAKTRANDLDDLAIKIGAIVWYLQETDAILDIKGSMQLRRFAIEARRLAKGS